MPEMLKSSSSDEKPLLNIWNHFQKKEEIASNKYSAICKYCNEKYSVRKPYNYGYNLSALVDKFINDDNNLKEIHKSFFKRELEEINKKNKDKQDKENKKNEKVEKKEDDKKDQMEPLVKKFKFHKHIIKTYKV
jgi:hypothetical protein